MPALLQHLPVHGGEGDEVLEALQLAHYQRAVRPWAGVRDVEVISALLWWEFGVGRGGDGGAELGGSTFEFSAFVIGGDPVGYAALDAIGVSGRESVGERQWWRMSRWGGEDVRQGGKKAYRCRWRLIHGSQWLESAEIPLLSLL